MKSKAGRWNQNNKCWIQDDVSSPFIDAVNPNTSIDYEPSPNGGIVKIGAYGGTAEASKTYVGKPVCKMIMAKDINGDCKVDLKDFAIMAVHWLEER